MRHYTVTTDPAGAEVYYLAPGHPEKFVGKAPVSFDEMAIPETRDAGGYIVRPQAKLVMAGYETATFSLDADQSNDRLMRRQYSKADIENGDYGPMPDSQECQKIIIAAIGATLLDPESANYRFGVLQKIHFRSHEMNVLDLWFGWKMTFQFNGKNAFGGYAGYETKTALFKNGRLVEIDPRILDDED